MFFESRDFYIDLVENKDLNKIIEVYNSNDDFLINHMGKKYVTMEWITEEMVSMKEAGFYSCKIMEKNTGNIIGIIDFNTNKEVYLSLLMIHNDCKNQGVGKQIFEALEEYVESLGSERMRIDVVNNFHNGALDFWIRNGFIKDKDITLEWAGETLPAVIMKKNL